MKEQHVERVQNVFAAINDRDWDEVAANYLPGAVIEYPQSGERIEGRDRIRSMMATFPEPPTFVLRNVFMGDDQSVIVEFDAVYSGVEPWKGVAIYRLSPEGIDREVAYFGAPFTPPEWRTGLST